MLAGAAERAKEYDAGNERSRDAVSYGKIDNFGKINFGKTVIIN